MRGVFDEREAERDRRRRGREERDREDGREEKRDREVTLGSFTLLAILFGLMVLCGLSFGLGFVVGRKEPAAQPASLEPMPIAAQGDGAKGKPSGGTGSGSGNSSASGAPDETAGLAGAEESGQHAGGLPSGSDSEDKHTESSAPGDSKGRRTGAESAIGTERIEPAAKGSQPAQAKVAPIQAKAVQTVAPLALMVQIATLASQEDADVLVGALRRRGYAVAAKREAADEMIHVRVGPFASRDLADQWRQKLLNDGYNAVVQ